VIDFTPVPDVDDQYQQPLVLDLIDNAVVADADVPERLRAGEFEAAGRARIVGEGQNGNGSSRR
jgi:hypothetical protein